MDSKTTDSENDFPVEYIIAIVIGVFVLLCVSIFILYASGKFGPCVFFLLLVVAACLLIAVEKLLKK